MAETGPTGAVEAQQKSPMSNHQVDKTESDKKHQKGPPQACLFVASMSSETTEEALTSLFSQFGEVLKTTLLKDRTQRPYAFVQYKLVEHASSALSGSASISIDGRRLRVEKAKVNTTLFVAKMGSGVPQQQLREEAEQFGPVESVSIIKNHQTGKSKGCGFVKFFYREDAMEAFMGLKNSQRKWVVEWATSVNDPDSLGIDRCNIFIGGLNPAVTKEDIEARFGQFGKIDNVTLVKKDIAQDSSEEELSNKTCFAFVHFTDPEASVAAIERSHGSEWLDRRIRVQYCESQEMKNKRRANKYQMNQYGNQYGVFRGVQHINQVLGGAQMYGVPQRGGPPFSRNGEEPYSQQPAYVGYPIQPGMLPGTMMPYPGQYYFQGQVGQLQQQVQGMAQGNEHTPNSDILNHSGQTQQAVNFPFSQQGQHSHPHQQPHSQMQNPQRYLSTPGDFQHMNGHSRGDESLLMNDVANGLGQMSMNTANANAPW